MLTQPQNAPDDYTSISYADAPVDLQAEALHLVKAAFEAYLPALTTEQWQDAMCRCYPVLEVGGGTIELRENDLTRLATYLQYEQAPSLPYAPYCSASHHVSHKLLGFSRRAVDTLKQTATLSPLNKQQALALYRDALESMAGGDAVAMNIQQAFAFKMHNGLRVHKVYPQEISIVNEVFVSPDSPAVTRTRAIEELPEHWDHLQLWFRQTNDRARPWNVSAIASQLKLSQPVVRALLTAPKGTNGVSRTAFTKTRLRLLQRFFRLYGYEPPM